MDKGALIYRKKSNNGLLYGIILFALWLDVVTWSSEVEGKLIAFIFINLGFVFIPYLMIQVSKNRPGFYEYGLGYFKNNRCVDWTPYHEFNEVSCFVSRESIKESRRNLRYVIVFQHADGSYTQLIHSSAQELKQIWQTILAKNPILRDRLTLYHPKSLGARRPYHGKNGKPVVLTEDDILPQTEHPASKILLDVLTMN